MNKQLIVLALSVLFLFPGLTYASSIDEQRQAIMSQLITLLEAQIASLQAQLAAQAVTATSTPIEATSTPEVFVCRLARETKGHVGSICGG